MLDLDFRTGRFQIDTPALLLDFLNGVYTLDDIDLPALDLDFRRQSFLVTEGDIERPVLELDFLRQAFIVEVAMLDAQAGILGLRDGGAVLRGAAVLAGPAAGVLGLAGAAGVIRGGALMAGAGGVLALAGGAGTLTANAIMTGAAGVLGLTDAVALFASANLFGTALDADFLTGTYTIDLRAPAPSTLGLVGSDGVLRGGALFNIADRLALVGGDGVLVADANLLAPGDVLGLVGGGAPLIAGPISVVPARIVKVPA